VFNESSPSISAFTSVRRVYAVLQRW